MHGEIGNVESNTRHEGNVSMINSGLFSLFDRELISGCGPKSLFVVAVSYLLFLKFFKIKDVRK